MKTITFGILSTLLVVGVATFAYKNPKNSTCTQHKDCQCNQKNSAQCKSTCDKKQACCCE